MIHAFLQENNKLQNLEVIIADIEIQNETINSIEFAYDNTRPIIRGQIFFEDLYDMNMITNWSEAKIKITYIDALDEMFMRTFNVVGVQEDKSGLGRKSLIITFVDEFSFALANSYISRSFRVPLNRAILQIAKDLGVSELDQIDFDFSDVPFLRPYMTVKNSNSLTYFTRELYRRGFTFYQTKKGIHIKSFDDLIPKDLELNGVFKDDPDNQLYSNKILESNIIQNNRYMAEPDSAAVAYDANKKEVIKIDDDILDSLRLNSEPVKLNKTKTRKEYTQPQMGALERKLDLKRNYMDQNILQIYVSGYIKNDLNQIYDTLFKGNVSFAESQQRGDESIQGKYVSKQIQEKIIKGSYVQMITLHRADRIRTSVDEDDEETF